MIHSLGPYSQYSGHYNTMMCTISGRDDGVFYEGIHVQMALPVRITILRGSMQHHELIVDGMQT